MGRKNSAQTYSFALLGIVSLVALVAIVLIVSTFSPGSWVQENVRGQAASNVNADQINHRGKAHDIHTVPNGGSFLGGQMNLDDIFQNKIRVSSTINSKLVVRDIDVGDTVPFGSHTVTLYGIEDGDARVVVASNADACGQVAGQTPLCRGESSCCGGVCTTIPTCVGRPDGLIFTCGNRQMYCCNAELSLVACGVSS